MQIHAAAAALEIDIDSFIDKYCEVNEKLDDFYIKEFKNKAHNLLDKVKKIKGSK